MKLIDLLCGDLSYDSQWGIYAEKINGKWESNSPARLGQRVFENGGLLDACEFFASNSCVVDFREGYSDGDSNFYEEWAADYIQELNEATYDDDIS